MFFPPLPKGFSEMEGRKISRSSRSALRGYAPAGGGVPQQAPPSPALSDPRRFAPAGRNHAPSACARGGIPGFSSAHAETDFRHNTLESPAVSPRRRPGFRSQDLRSVDSHGTFQEMKSRKMRDMPKSFVFPQTNPVIPARGSYPEPAGSPRRILMISTVMRGNERFRFSVLKKAPFLSMLTRFPPCGARGRRGLHLRRPACSAGAIQE